MVSFQYSTFIITTPYAFETIPIKYCYPPFLILFWRQYTRRYSTLPIPMIFSKTKSSICTSNTFPTTVFSFVPSKMILITYHLLVTFSTFQFNYVSSCSNFCFPIARMATVFSTVSLFYKVWSCLKLFTTWKAFLNYPIFFHKISIMPLNLVVNERCGYFYHTLRFPNVICGVRTIASSYAQMSSRLVLCKSLTGSWALPASGFSPLIREDLYTA